MSISRSGLLMLALVLVSDQAVRGQVNAEAKEDGRSLEMDDPANEASQNRIIWESTHNTPYETALAHIQAVRGNAPRNATVTLPTGWAFAPAGSQIPVGTLPFAAAFFHGAVVTVNSGDSGGPQSISAVEPLTGQTLQTISMENVFPGIATGLGDDLLVSGGYSNAVYRYDPNYNLVQSYSLPGYAGGIAVIDSTHFAVTYSEAPVIEFFRPGHVAIIDATTGASVADQALGLFEPYSVQLAGGKLYVTIPAEDQVDIFDTHLNALGTVSVASGPFTSCASASAIYVVNMNSDSLSVVDSSSNQLVKTIPVNFRNQLFGAAPTSCAVDGNTLYVTLANVNAIELINTDTTTFEGYIPTGWYPTAVLTNDTGVVYVSAKGIQPRRPNPDGQYVLSLLQGSVGTISQATLQSNLPGWTNEVLSSSPEPAPDSPSRPLIEHIFFIVKENRTYDQILGDLPVGNGDPALVSFGYPITPVQHYISQEFVTLDNFFCDGEVSTVGHSYTTSAYASPYFETLTSLEYSGRLSGTSEFDPGAFSPQYLWDKLLTKNVPYHVFGEAVYLSSLYNALADYLGVTDPMVEKVRAGGLSQRPGSPAWLALADLLNANSAKAGSVDAIVSLLRSPSFGQPFSQFFTGDNSLYTTLNSNPILLLRIAKLLSNYDFAYRFFDLSYSDLNRIAHWLPYFQSKVAAGTLEPFEYLILPNDHTGGPIGTPNNYVAENDAALDIFMRALSASNVWKNSVVLVVEDDAQDGTDHVDATRTTAYVAGPRVLHGQVDSDHFDQDSMFRSISWLLNISPLNMNDGLAVPMASVFSPAGTTPDLTYTPPPVSTSLVPSDALLYQQLLTQLGQQPAK